MKKVNRLKSLLSIPASYYKIGSVEKKLKRCYAADFTLEL